MGRGAGVKPVGPNSQLLPKICFACFPNDDYDNGVSDNCDLNFGTFDDFGVKNDQKVPYNMILMSKYKGQHGGKKGSKNSDRGLPPPFSGNARKKTFFLTGGLPLYGRARTTCPGIFLCEIGPNRIIQGEPIRNGITSARSTIL